MGPGLYSEIGKKAKDLLYKDYQTDQKFSVTTYTSNGVAITATGTKKNDFILGEIHSQIKNKNVTLDIKTSSSSSLTATVTHHEVGMPGLKGILSFSVPDQKSGKAELQYLHDYAGVTASMGLTTNPVVNMSTVIGTKAFAAGTDVSFDTAKANFVKYNAGLSITTADLIASVNLINKGETLSASYYHLVSPLTNTAVGAELIHSFSSGENTLTFGTQHALDPLTTVKARFDSAGKASALIQHEWRPKSLFTISAEVDTKAIEKSSKLGLSLALKP
jgi:voltage-dependent anion channel protein 2